MADKPTIRGDYSIIYNHIFVELSRDRNTSGEASAMLETDRWPNRPK